MPSNPEIGPNNTNRQPETRPGVQKPAQPPSKEAIKWIGGVATNGGKDGNKK